MKTFLLAFIIALVSISSANAQTGVMDIQAVLVRHVHGTWLVHFSATVNGATTDYEDTEIAIYGLPDGLATGDSWHGTVYPCGEGQSKGGMVYHLYALSQDAADKILARQAAEKQQSAN